MPKITPVIMCGGSGTRMWPESRESLPKQFIPLIGQRSTFQTIVSVVSDPAVFDPAVVITNFDYRFRVAEQLKEIGAEAVILLEPDRRDSAAAVVFRADVMLEELERFEPEIAEATAAAVANAKKDLGFVVLDHQSFAKAPKTSIDYAVMERTDRAVVLTADVGWSDVGEWSTVWRLSPRDADGNSLRGRAVVIDSSNVLVRSEEQLAAVIGLKDVIVVATGDAVLVADRSQTAKVKTLVESLKAQGHPEATEHRRNYRPWGYYQSIDQGSRYQVKRIVVRPGGSLSLQKHHHRAEHWIVVRGAAEVTLNDKVTLVHENESIYLPIGSTHRLANPGKIDVELIEVQTGSYFGEDDIVRIDDVYSRA